MLRSQTHSQSGFGTLTLIGIVVLLLLITGIGQAMWRHSTQLGAYCRDGMLSIGFNAGLDICESIGHSIVSFQRYLEHQVGSTSFGDSMDLEQFSGYLARQFSSAAIGYQSPQLSGLINPSMLRSDFNWNGASEMDRLSFSLTQGAQGSALLRQGNTSGGLGFLRSSASMGEMGVLSQLQLGSSYAKGSGGLPADPARARYYYQQALQSIQSLQQQNTPASQKLLTSLPAEPNTMQSHLTNIINQ